MKNKMITLETVIEMAIEAAADTEDLQMIMDLLYNKADELDRKITELEEEI